MISSCSAKVLGVPAWIENDANAGALAEHRIGAGRGSKHMIMVAAGTGIGGGFVLDGKLYHGASGGAGEVGHMQMDPTGRLCGCGRRGCLEAVASGWALSADAADIAAKEPDGLVARISVQENEEPDGRILDLAAAQGDVSAIEVLTRAGVFLGAGLTNLIDLFNPEVIVIGGGVIAAGEMLLAPARREMLARALTPGRDAVRVVPAAFGDEAGMIGAAILAREEAL